MVESTKKFTSVIVALFLLAGAAAALSACETTAGFGQDVAKTGNAITNSAEKNK